MLEKETKFASEKTKKEIAALESELNRRNGYLHLFKADDQKKKEEADEAEGKNTIYAYDQCKRDETDHGYVQKAARESYWYRPKGERPDAKLTQAQALTTSQVYGWREPLDNMKTGFARVQVCRKNFYDAGHL